MSQPAFKVPKEEVRRLAEGRWDYVFSALMPGLLDQAMRAAPEHVPHPLQGGKDGFRLFRDWMRTGGGAQNTPEMFFSDGFALIREFLGVSFNEALRLVYEALNGSDYVPPIEVAKRSEEESSEERAKKSIRAAGFVWSKSENNAQFVKQYLAKRGVGMDILPSSIKGLKSNPYIVSTGGERVEIGKFDCMIARFSDVNGKTVGVHRTYLENGDKIKGHPAKKTLGSLSGAAIKLVPATDDYVAVGEGIETMLAVHKHLGQPVWAAGTATLLEQLEFDSSIKRVCIFADNDKSGRGIDAAMSLRDRLVMAGLKVWIFVPPMLENCGKGTDWCDIANRAPECFENVKQHLLRDFCYL